MDKEIKSHRERMEELNQRAIERLNERLDGETSEEEAAAIKAELEAREEKDSNEQP